MHGVTVILGTRRETQVLFGIIQAVTVSMVNNFATRSVHNLPVHIYDFSAEILDSVIYAAFWFPKLPRIFGQFLIILGVNDGVSVFYINIFVCEQFYSSKRDAVVFFPVAKKKINNNVFDERWTRNFKTDFNSGHNNSPSKNCRFELRYGIIRNAIIRLFYVIIRSYVKY
jgi:hypothetical protein